MKLYNKELEEIQDEKREKRINEIVEKNISFLVKKYKIDENILRKRTEKLSVVEREGETHYVISNGERHEVKNGGDIASFVTIKDMEFDGEKWSFENAVYTSDNNGNHVLAHELFHFLAANTQMDFNSNGIGYEKMGVSIHGYNKEDEEIDVGMNAKGLNEGITEMLAMGADGLNEPWNYYSQSYLASILANSQDNSLINAYFSEDSKEFQKFLEDFDKRQSVISSKKLISLSTRKDEDIDIELLEGCLDYSLSFCKDMEQLTNERKRLLPIFKSMYMQDGLNIGFSDKDFNLKEFFKDKMSSKRQEIENNQIQKDEIISNKDIEKEEQSKKRFENIKKSIENEKITESERKEELAEVSEIIKLNKIKAKENKTEEEKRLLYENEKENNQVQDDYRRSIDSKNKDDQGLSI